MKRLTTRLTITLIVVLIMTSTAFAGGVDFAPVSVEQSPIKTMALYQSDSSHDENKILMIAEQANADVKKEISKAQAKALNVKNDAQLDKIIEKLLTKTEMIVEKAIIKIEKYGGQAVCELVGVEIGDRVVLVDPIRIVRL